VQVEFEAANFETVFSLHRQKVETRRFQAMGQLDSRTCIAPHRGGGPARRRASARLLCLAAVHVACESQGLETRISLDDRFKG
jgi:hypothetical protein